MRKTQWLWAWAAGITLAQGIQFAPPGFAHQVEISGEVGGTVHLEPNDTPSAGEPSQAWFALVKQGGTAIPLEECDCQLAVYAQPYKAGDAPLQQPALQPISQESYTNIPGAEITFPQVGAYVLVMQGKPKAGATFQPFELQFDVTVATGQTAPQAVNPTPTSPKPAETPAETTPAADQARTRNNEATQTNRIAWIAGAGLLIGAIAAIGIFSRRKP